MPVISGGGGGNTTAQVAASGKVLPVADATGVTVDTTTYANGISHAGFYTTLVFSTETALLAVADLGGAFPKWLMGNDADFDGLLFGDGVHDLTTAQHQGAISAGTNSDGSIYASLAGGSTGIRIGYLVTNYGKLLNVNAGVRINGAAIVDAGAGAPSGGGYVGDLYIRTDGPGSPVLYQCSAAGTAGNAIWVPVLTPGSPVGIVTSGALSTVQLVTATGRQILTTRDAETITPCTFNPGAATTATVTAALSPDNVTYSTLAVVTEPAGVALDGTILPVNVRVPAGWYLKLTVNAQAVLGLTTYW